MNDVVRWFTLPENILEPSPDGIRRLVEEIKAVVPETDAGEVRLAYLLSLTLEDPTSTGEVWRLSADSDGVPFENWKHFVSSAIGLDPGKASRVVGYLKAAYRADLTPLSFIHGATKRQPISWTKFRELAAYIRRDDSPLMMDADKPLADWLDDCRNDAKSAQNIREELKRRYKKASGKDADGSFYKKIKVSESEAIELEAMLSALRGDTGADDRSDGAIITEALRIAADSASDPEIVSGSQAEFLNHIVDLVERRVPGLGVLFVNNGGDVPVGLKLYMGHKEGEIVAMFAPDKSWAKKAMAVPDCREIRLISSAGDAVAKATAPDLMLSPEVTRALATALQVHAITPKDYPALAARIVAANPGGVEDQNAAMLQELTRLINAVMPVVGR